MKSPKYIAGILVAIVFFSAVKGYPATINKAFDDDNKIIKARKILKDYKNSFPNYPGIEIMEDILDQPIFSGVLKKMGCIVFFDEIGNIEDVYTLKSKDYFTEKNFKIRPYTRSELDEAIEEITKYKKIKSSIAYKPLPIFSYSLQLAVANTFLNTSITDRYEIRRGIGESHHELQLLKIKDNSTIKIIASDALYVTGSDIKENNTDSNSYIDNNDFFYGSRDFDRINAFIPDQDDGYYIAGASGSNELTLGWVHHCLPGEGKNSIDNFIKQHPELSNSLLFDLLQLSNGDLIAVGSGLPVNQLQLPQSKQKDNGWLVRFNSNKEIVWSRIYSSTHHQRLYCIEKLADGNILVGGRSETTQKTGASNGVTYIIEPETGRIIHTKEWGENIRRSGFYSCHTLPNGGYILVGWATDDTTGKDDVWIVSVKPDHSEYWSKIWGGDGDDLGYKALVEENGDLLVFGWGTRKNAQYTSGLFLRLKPDGKIDRSVFLDVGDIGNDRFFSGVSFEGKYICAGDASISPNRNDGKAWIVMLNHDLKIIGERHFDNKGSRFLKIDVNTLNNIIAGGYGSPPNRIDVDAFISIFPVKELGTVSGTTSAKE